MDKDDKIQYVTIEYLIDEAKSSLKYGALFPALSLTFALISACANVEYPNEWFKKSADNNEYMKEHFPKNYNEEGEYLQKNSSNHDKERFIMWIDTMREPTVKGKGEELLKKYKESRIVQPSTLNGELIYQLRCALLHEASSDIDFQDTKKITCEGNRKIGKERFILWIQKYNPQGGYTEMNAHASENSESTMEISVVGLVIELLTYVERYYMRNKERFKKIPAIDYR